MAYDFMKLHRRRERPAAAGRRLRGVGHGVPRAVLGLERQRHAEGRRRAEQRQLEAEGVARVEPGRVDLEAARAVLDEHELAEEGPAGGAGRADEVVDVRLPDERLLPALRLVAQPQAAVDHVELVEERQRRGRVEERHARLAGLVGRVPPEARAGPAVEEHARGIGVVDVDRQPVEQPDVVEPRAADRVGPGLDVHVVPFAEDVRRDVLQHLAVAVDRAGHRGPHPLLQRDAAGRVVRPVAELRERRLHRGAERVAWHVRIGHAEVGIEDRRFRTPRRAVEEQVDPLSDRVRQGGPARVRPGVVALTARHVGPGPVPQGGPRHGADDRDGLLDRDDGGEPASGVDPADLAGADEDIRDVHVTAGEIGEEPRVGDEALVRRDDRADAVLGQQRRREVELGAHRLPATEHHRAGDRDQLRPGQGEPVGPLEQRDRRQVGRRARSSRTGDPALLVEEDVDDRPGLPRELPPRPLTERDVPGDEVAGARGVLDPQERALEGVLQLEAEQPHPADRREVRLRPVDHHRVAEPERRPFAALQPRPGGQALHDRGPVLGPEPVDRVDPAAQAGGHGGGDGSVPVGPARERKGLEL
jgi:hypothetical protein